MFDVGEVESGALVLGRHGQVALVDEAVNGIRRHVEDLGRLRAEPHAR